MRWLPVEPKRPEFSLVPGAIATPDECAKVVRMFSEGDGAAGVHRAWVEGMLAQERPVEPARRCWDELHREDRELDARIASEVAIGFLGWVAEGAESDLEGRALELALPLFDEAFWPKPTTDHRGGDEEHHATLIADWASERGARACYQAWRDGMVVQSRWLKTEHRAWEVLPARDRVLFAHIAAYIVFHLWAWLVEHDNDI